MHSFYIRRFFSCSPYLRDVLSSCSALSCPGSEYLVAGHEDWKTNKLMVNTKSLVKPWKSSLGRKFLHILKKDCGQR